MSHPEPEQLTRMFLGAVVTRALTTVVDLGLPDRIDAGSPQPVEALAKAVGAHERSLYRLLRFLAGHGVFEEKPGRTFDHSPLSRRLRSDAKDSYLPAARMFGRIAPAFDGMQHAVMTGEAAFVKVFGKPLFDYLGDEPDLAPLFDAGMTAVHGHETGAMLDAYDFSGVEVLADIGGGNGSLLSAVLGRYTKMKGILFDLGHVIGRARALMASNGLEGRCDVVEGNFFETIPKGADAYLFRHIIHDWTDAQCVGILENCRKVIPSSGRLLIVEAVVPAGNGDALAKHFDMAMLIWPGGLERTEEEYRALLRQAGFRLHGVTPTSSVVSVIEGRPV